MRRTGWARSPRLTGDITGDCRWLKGTLSVEISASGLAPPLASLPDNLGPLRAWRRSREKHTRNFRRTISYPGPDKKCRFCVMSLSNVYLMRNKCCGWNKWLWKHSKGFSPGVQLYSSVFDLAVCFVLGGFVEQATWFQRDKRSDKSPCGGEREAENLAWNSWGIFHGLNRSEKSRSPCQ